MLRKILITLLLFCFYVSQAWGVILIRTTDSQPTPFFSSDFEDSTDRSQWTLFYTPTPDLANQDITIGGSYVARVQYPDSGYVAIERSFSESATGTLCIIWSMQVTEVVNTIGSWEVQFLEDGGNIIRFAWDANGAVQLVDITEGYSSKSSNGVMAVDTTATFKIVVVDSTSVNLYKWGGSSWGSAIITYALTVDHALAINELWLRGTGSMTSGEYYYYDDVHMFYADYTGDPGDL